MMWNNDSWNNLLNCKLSDSLKTAQYVNPLRITGRLNRMVGLTLESSGCRAAIGEKCYVQNNSGYIEAEVVGFSEDKSFLMPSGDVRGLLPGAKIIPTGKSYMAKVGDNLLGRVIDSNGIPLDDLGPIGNTHPVPLFPNPINPLERNPVKQPLDVGVRSINALLTVGRGQRMGLFSGSGVGKSVLLGMMTKNTSADVTVVALVGERGREVKDFVDNILGKEGMRKAIVVAAPADTSPMMRIHCAYLATSIAEYYREMGLDVLLLMDSLTRYAQAQREIALAISEPPATKGYPPSVFSKIPQLVERVGNNANSGGSITAFYTVLTEGDDPNDPIADSARAILDGHIVLSRELSDSGIYPAIDIEPSISRVMADIVSNDDIKMARTFKAIYSKYRTNQDLINVGAYKEGSNPEIDQAIRSYPKLIQFLMQDVSESSSYDKSIQQLRQLIISLSEKPSIVESQ